MTALLLVALCAAPPFSVEPALQPQARVEATALEAWADCAKLFTAATAAEPTASKDTVRVVRGGVRSGHGGASTPGLISLRQGGPALTEDELLALRHEVAHQFLFAACPAASGDALFHEAFAASASGELPRWSEGPYLSLTEALKELAQARTLDTPRPRRALARLLEESTPAGAALATALGARLKLCANQSAWPAMAAAELARPSLTAKVAASLVLSRHSGEVLLRQGPIELSLPFGSTLKPFLVAGAAAAPKLSPRRGAPEWSCGEQLPSVVGAQEALPRSCNGYFLDWGAQAAAIASFGAWGPVLRAVGLSGLPSDVPEAIGLKASLSIAPLGLAAAYRALAAGRPDVIALLEETPRSGTLAGLLSPQAVKGVAFKTGTVRDGGSRPLYGWLVAITDDVVIVAVDSDVAPRANLPRVLELLSAARSLPGAQRAAVQVLGLLPEALVHARCARGGVAFGAGGAPRIVEEGPLAQLTREGAALCLGAPWAVSFPGLPSPRPYAGAFAYQAPPPYRPPAGALPTERERRARTGSAFVFTTTRLLYTAGVVGAEDSRLRGEPRVALGRVVAHNEAHAQERHSGRPLCDTTHCQAFQGTLAPTRDDARAVAAAALPSDDWLNFSQGGAERWDEERPRAAVEALLGPLEASARLSFRNGRVFLERPLVLGEAILDDDGPGRPCELVRGPLKLPACPTAAQVQGARVLFWGKGRGHGVGLEVERARSSALPSEELLEEAFHFERVKPAP